MKKIIVMTSKQKKVFEYFYYKDEQPTYEQASKDLGIAVSAIHWHICRMEKDGICKRNRFGEIKWLLD